MSAVMNFSNTKPLGDLQKDSIKLYVKNSLIEIMGECDDVVLEYVMVMIINGKTMEQISNELETFVGEPACSDFAKSLGEKLMSLEKPEGSATKKPKIISLKSSSANNDRLSGELSSSRHGDKANPRLLQSALKTSLSTGRDGSSKNKDRDTENGQDNGNNQKRMRTGQGQNSQQSQRAPRQSIHDRVGGPVQQHQQQQESFPPQVHHPMNQTVQIANVLDAQAKAAGFENAQQMMDFYQQNMVALMVQNANFQQQMAMNPYGGGGYGHFHSDRGRGAYRGRGRFNHNDMSHASTIAAPHATEEKKADVATKTVSEDSSSNAVAQSSEAPPQGTFDPSARAGRSFRGRSSASFRGRGRVARGGGRGAPFVSMNKKWELGPGVETPLVTDR